MNEESENLREASAQMPASAHSGPSIGRRFYKSAYAAIAPPSSSSSSSSSACSEKEEGGYVVMLDHRILKTPSKKPLKVPSFALAHAIAAEWEYQVFFSLSLDLFLHRFCIRHRLEAYHLWK
jgi:ATP synthase F1 complex assembly factor 2